MTGEFPRRRALLLGCGTFTDPGLAQLQSPRQDVTQLAAVLRDPRFCRYDVTAEVDCDSRRAMRLIEEFFDRARVTDGMNLLYLSCHGLQNPKGRLFFAFADTERDFLGSTAVSAEWVRECIYASRAKATVVLVDCCFSGAFIKGMQARSAGVNVESMVREIPQGTGLAVLTASGDLEASFEDAESPAGRPSYFTEALIAGIRTGAADLNRDRKVTADELYDYVYDTITRGPSPQRPRRLGAGEGTLVVSDAAAPPPDMEIRPAPPPNNTGSRSPSDPPTPQHRDYHDGESAGISAAEELPLAVLTSIFEHEFDLLAWLVPWRRQWGLAWQRQAASEIPRWLPELAVHLGGHAAPPEVPNTAFRPQPEFVNGFIAGMRRVWNFAVSADFVRPGHPARVPWRAVLPAGRTASEVSVADFKRLSGTSRISASRWALKATAAWTLIHLALFLLSLLPVVFLMRVPTEVKAWWLFQAFLILWMIRYAAGRVSARRTISEIGPDPTDPPARG